MDFRDGTATSATTPFSVVIPTFNRRELLIRCLKSLFRYAPEGTEVIVVDDGSRDGTADAVRAIFPHVRLIELASNRGFCAAANAGWKAASHPVVELLNNDAEVTEGWATPSLAEFGSADVGFVAPLVRRMPFRRRIDSAGDHFFPFGLAKKRLEGKPADIAMLAATEVFSASASSAFYRKGALERVGGFPEHYGAYFDDVDLGCRLRLAGYRCRFVPQSQVLHWVSQSHRHDRRDVLAKVSANSERLFWTNLPPAQLAIMLLPHCAYLLALMAYKALKGEFGAWFAGKCSLLTEIPTLIRLRRAALGLRQQ